MYNCGNPTNDEQYLLELINHARANPDTEGILLATDTNAQAVFDFSYFPTHSAYGPTPAEIEADFATYPARPPLTFNADLCTAARGHDAEMLKVDSQYHVGPDGDPTSRMEAAGYTNWSNDGENVFAYGATLDDVNESFLVDWGNTDLGHRHNIMNFGSTDAIYNEIGIGVLHGGSGLPNVGTILTTEDFGLRMIDAQFTAPFTFVLGVVYTDSNKNGLYDIGEGDSGVTITLSSGSKYYAITTTSGGYAVPFTIGAGSVTVTATGGPYGKSSVSQTVQLDSVNVKVDFIAPLVQSAPGKVTLISPKNGATVTDTVAFTWDPVAGVSNYVLLVSTSNSLSKSFAVNDTLTGTVTADTATQFRLQPSTQYYWEVLAQNEGGTTPSTVWSFKTPATASVDEPLTEHTATSISPNPTTGESHIRFTLSTDADVTLHVYNTLGEEVQSLALGQLAQSAYDYALDFSKLAVGSYTYELNAGDKTETGRIVIMR